MTRTVYKALVLLGIASLSACAIAPEYYYAPEPTTTVTRAGVPIQSFAVPPESALGYTDVSTFGIVQTPRGDRTLHVRMEVSNTSAPNPWTVDVRDQLVDIPGVGQSHPLSVNAGLQTLPIVTVARGQQATIDLYYPLPSSIHDAEDLAGFDFAWRVITSSRPVTGRAHISRIEVEDAATAPVYVATWGPYWWYDPLYPHVYVRANVGPHFWHRRW